MCQSMKDAEGGDLYYLKGLNDSLSQYDQIQLLTIQEQSSPAASFLCC